MISEFSETNLGITKDIDSEEYLNKIRNIPLLKHKSQMELFRLIRQGDQDAKAKLILANLRLVVKFSKRYRKLGLPFMDLIQEGNLGLMKAVDKFDYLRGYKFSTYAYWWIRHSIIQGIVKKSRLVYLPFHINEALSTWVATERNLFRKLKRAPTDEEIAKAMKLDLKSKKELLRWINAKFISIEPQSKDEKERINNAMVFYKDSILLQEPNFFQHMVGEERLQQMVSGLLGVLDGREQEILKMRLMSKRPLSLARLAKKFGLSRERVRQIEKEALAKLKRLTR